MTTKEILQFTNDFFDKDITMWSRKRKYTEPRFIFFYYARKYSEDKPSLEDIGMECGPRNHSTVLNGIKKFHQYCETDKRFLHMASDYHRAFKGVGGVVKLKMNYEKLTLTSRVEILSKEVEILKGKLALADTSIAEEKIKELERKLSQENLKNERKIQSLKSNSDMLKRHIKKLEEKLKWKSEQLDLQILKNKGKKSFQLNYGK